MNAYKMQLLGAAVRRLRQQHGQSLFDLATAMGWQGTSPLIAIEKGKRLPRPETLERLGACLGLRHADIVFLQGLAGYRQPTVLPPLEHIRLVLGDIAAAYPPEQLVFPVYVMDFQFRVWMANTASLIFLGDDTALMQAFVDQRRTILEIIFDSRLALTDAALSRDETNRDQVYRFKSRNLFRQHEDFYLAYPDCLRMKLTPSDYACFGRAWDEVQTSAITSYRIKTLNRTAVDGVPMDFVLEEHPIPQLEDMFFIVSYYPEPSPDNLRRCQTVFAAAPPRPIRWFMPCALNATAPTEPPHGLWAVHPQ